MTERMMKGMMLRGALSMGPVTHILFEDSYIDTFNALWDNLHPNIQEGWMRLAEITDSWLFHRILNWACENGGNDYTGTREEMTALVTTWNKEQGVLLNVRYSVIPYTQACGEHPCFPNPPENPRNSRMK
jgi:hypothetical protein